MTKASKATAIRLTIEALGVLVVAIFVAVKFEDRIAAVNWRLVSIVCVAAVALFGIYRWQMAANTYDVLDMVMKDGKADLYAHITVASFALAVWLVVQQALAKQPITELMLGVLGIFVAGKAAGGFSDAMKSRPAAPSGDTIIQPNSIVQQQAPPPAPPAAPTLGV